MPGAVRPRAKWPRWPATGSTIAIGRCVHVGAIMLRGSTAGVAARRLVARLAEDRSLNLIQ
ncbi:MAG: hypothetical protein ABI948_08105 [Thermoleophilia bacterium]